MIAGIIIFFWPTISGFLAKRKQKASVGPG
jgi:hypothetical protein